MCLNCGRGGHHHYPADRVAGVEGAGRPCRDGRPCPSARPVRRRPRPRRAAGRRGRGRLPRLLQEPGHRRDARGCSCGWPRSAGCASGSTRCSPASTINVTEDRAVLHVALRAPARRSIVVDGADVVPEVHAVLDRMAAFSERVRARRVDGPHRQADPQRRQHRHRRLRPRPGDGLRGAAASTATAGPDLPVRLQRRRHRLRRGDPRPRPGETLFIVSSKTFTTLETMTNARTARDWLLRGAGRRGGGREALRRRLDQRRRRCAKFGIDTANMFGFWDWVGGRYSMDSAIGLSTMIAIGPDAFREMLAGFHAMDEHFRTAPFERNLPVLMGLLDRLVRRLLRRPDAGRAALRPVPEAVPGLPPAADDGVERQVRDARRATASTTRPARSSGASRAPTASTASTS